MCGIAGVVSADGLRRDDPALVRQMLTELAHRGPDDEHVISDAHASLGARRLSIIDLDTGRQPLSNEDGSVWVTQNGEIYNYVELRRDLEARGHSLTTAGDTEVIAHLYEDVGDRFVDHLRGMFAIALWDAKRRRLVLARDRLGKKPLYWRLHDGRLTYGSELKALVRDASLPREVDREALGLYLQYQYVPAPQTIYAGVQKLPPATVLTWEGGAPRTHRYWSPAYEPKSYRTSEDARDACLELLRESVRLRLRSDVPVGVFLSGGIDSSIVTALMAEASPTPVPTFSIGFDDREFDELPYARAVATRFGTDHKEEVVTLDALELLPRLAYHFDEPFGDSSAVPTFRVAELARRHLKVVLTGDGGDEAFGGYRRYRFQSAMSRLSRVAGPANRTIASVAQKVLARTAAGTVLARRAEDWGTLAALAPDERYVTLMSTFGTDLRHRLLGGDTGEHDGYLGRVLMAGPTDDVDRVMWADTLTYLPEDLLVKTDRATMANSVEARAPLLDHRVVEFAAALPARMKIRGRTTKFLLRQVARTLLPAGVIDRPKMGFDVPVNSWFRGSLGERFTELVLAADAESRDHLDQAVAASLLADHRAGLAQHGARLWVLLMFEAWARTWLRDTAIRL